MRRLLVVPDAPSREPLLELFRVLIWQGVVSGDVEVLEPALEGSGLTVRRLSRDPRSDDEVSVLSDWLGAVEGGLLVVNCILADAESLGADPVRVHQGEVTSLRPGTELVRSAIELIQAAQPAAREVNGHTQTLEELKVVNVALPSKSPGSLPDGINDRGPTAGWWTNILVTPEIQRAADSPAVLVESDESYVAHAAASILSIVGLWNSSVDDWEYPGWGQDVNGKDDALWSVVRTRSRSVVAAELPDRIIGRMCRRDSRLPRAGDHKYRFVDESAGEELLDEAVACLVRAHELTRVAPPSPDSAPPLKRMGLLEFLRLLSAWITGRLPGLVADRINDRIDEAKRAVNDRTQKALGLSGTELEVRVFDGLQEESGRDGGDVEVKPGSTRGIMVHRGEPQVWRAIRSTAFGLLDGGDLPDEELDRFRTSAGVRFVLAHPGEVVPPPEPPMFEPSQATRDFGIGPDGQPKSVVDPEWALGWAAALDACARAAPEGGRGGDAPAPGGEPTDDPVARDRAFLEEALDAARGSLLWKLGEHIFEQRNATREELQRLRAELSELTEGPATGGTPGVENAVIEAKRSKRRALAKLAITMAVLIALGIVAVMGICWLSIAALPLLVLLCIGLAAAWVWVTARAIVGCVYAWFLAEHQLYWRSVGHRQMLEVAIEFEEVQLLRFDYLLETQADWAQIISMVVHHPFRVSEPRRPTRIRNQELHLPASHQVEEGYAYDARMDGLVNAVAEKVVTQGWLSMTYSSCLDYAKTESRIRGTGDQFAPDEDTSSLAMAPGPRRELRSAIASRRARRRRELEVLRTAHEVIRRKDLGELFSPLPGNTRVETFLEEATLGPPTNFNQQVIPLQDDDLGLGYLVPVRKVNSLPVVDVSGLPDLPGPEQLAQGEDLSFPPLVFTAWSLDLLEEVRQSSIQSFGDQPAATIDLTKATHIWKPPVDWDPFVEEVIQHPGGVPEGWTIDSLTIPPLKDEIKPDPAFQPHGRSGPYAFLREVDGEPVGHRNDAVIKYAVRQDCAPPEAFEIVIPALQTVANVTGHTFVFDGLFNGLPGPGEAERIEIGWAPDDEYNLYEESAGYEMGRSIGLGGPGGFVRDPSSGSWHWTGGSVLIRCNLGERYSVGFTIGYSHGEVLLHELGHVMGLHHVSSELEIMAPATPANPAVGPHLRFGPGDELGLRQVVEAAG